MAYRAAKALVALLAVAPLADAHSWVEFLKRINPDGSFAKGTGYPIPYVARGAPGFSDDALINRIVDTKSNPSVCKQGNFKYSKDAPRLSAAAGDYVAMLYEENGHVTQPGITKRPYRSGNVYVYGTLKKTAETGINDVLYSWNAQGTGGDKRGQLLATHFYDDGQCYQNLGGVEPDPQANIYTNRRKKYGATAIDCQSAFRLPTNLPEKGIYNVMWVWDWPLITGDNTNVTEIYTSCAEIELGSKKSNSGQRINFSSDHNVTNGAIQSQIHTLIEAVTLGSGTNSPPAPTATAGNPAPTSATATGGASVTTGPATVTVTVTAPPVTTTVFQTVTFGAPQASSSLASGSVTDSAVASPTKQPSLAPTNVPTQVLPSFPSDLPSVFPTARPSSTRSSSSTRLPSTFQTSVKSSSTSSSSSSSATSSTSSPTVTQEGPLPGFPAVTRTSTLSSTKSDDGPVPGFPNATGVSSSTRSGSTTSSAAVTASSSAAVQSSSVVVQSPSSAAPSATASRSESVSGFPTSSRSSIAAAPTLSLENPFPTPGFPTRTATKSSIPTASVAASETRSVPVPSTFQTVTRPASSSAPISEATASSAPAVTQSQSSSAAATTTTHSQGPSSSVTSKAAVSTASSPSAVETTSKATSHSSAPAPTKPAVTPGHGEPGSPPRPTSAPASFVPVTSVAGFLP